MAKEMKRMETDKENSKNRNVKFGDLIFLHLVLLIYTFGSIFSKNAASYDFLSLGFCVFYGLVLIVSVIYAFLWQKVLKRLPLIMAYANKAITVIWGLVWGLLFFKEDISICNGIGAIIIIFGVYLVVTGEEET